MRLAGMACLLLFCCLSFCSLSYAQDTSPHASDTLTIRVSTEFVVLDALVANKKTGNLIGNLQSSDFAVTPDFSSGWHIKFVYESPKSLDVVDLNVSTLDYGTLASTDIRLLLQVGY